MSVPRALLGLLELEPRHGYDLKREYDARFGADRPLQYGQVYATLARLERDGLIAVTGTETAEGPERTTYAVTSAGVDELERWLSEPESAAPYLQSTVFIKVVLALLSGRSPQAVLDAQRAAHLVVMRHLTAQKVGATLVEAVTLDFALFHLDADVRWVAHTAARLDRLATEIRPRELS